MIFFIYSVLHSDFWWILDSKCLKTSYEISRGKHKFLKMFTFWWNYTSCVRENCGHAYQISFRSGMKARALQLEALQGCLCSEER